MTANETIDQQDTPTRLLNSQPQPQQSKLDSKPPLRLNLGCGFYKANGWINVDIVKEVEPDLLEDITQLPGIEPGTVDEIYLGHALEHVEGLGAAMFRWYQLLKPGGTITITVPDHAGMMDLWMKGAIFPALNVNASLGLLAVTTGFIGYADYIQQKKEHPTKAEAQRHRRVFDMETLAIVMEACGFQNVEQLYDHPCMPVDCYKVPWQMCLRGTKVEETLSFQPEADTETEAA